MNDRQVGTGRRVPMHKGGSVYHHRSAMEQARARLRAGGATNWLAAWGTFAILMDRASDPRDPAMESDRGAVKESERSLAEVIGTDPKTLRRHLAILEKAGLVVRKSAYGMTLSEQGVRIPDFGWLTGRVDAEPPAWAQDAVVEGDRGERSPVDMAGEKPGEKRPQDSAVDLGEYSQDPQDVQDPQDAQDQQDQQDLQDPLSLGNKSVRFRKGPPSPAAGAIFDAFLEQFPSPVTDAEEADWVSVAEELAGVGVKPEEIYDLALAWKALGWNHTCTPKALARQLGVLRQAVIDWGIQLDDFA
jgi:hypothetical protein